jgi:hypothetical protein
MQCNKEGGMQKISDFLFLIFLWFWKIKPLTQFIKNNTQPPIEMATAISFGGQGLLQRYVQ